jgi:CheY-like chemotaxis protein
MDGYSLIRKIRSRDIGGDVPAIALTAYARAEDAARAKRAGYQEHLTKPIDAPRLVDAVRRWCQGLPAPYADTRSTVGN